MKTLGESAITQSAGARDHVVSREKDSSVILDFNGLKLD
jgi:hypothetical protein